MKRVFIIGKDYVKITGNVHIVDEYGQRHNENGETVIEAAAYPRAKVVNYKDRFTEDIKDDLVKIHIYKVVSGYEQYLDHDYWIAQPEFKYLVKIIP